MHRTHMGVDQDYQNLLLAGCPLRTGRRLGRFDDRHRTAGHHVRQRLCPSAAQINLGVLKEDEVNIIVHGHEPLLSEMLVAAGRGSRRSELAKATGAKGINLAGMCCTANEILMRHGIPVAGNFLQQELAIVTGAVDAMVVDVQCEMQSLQRCPVLSHEAHHHIAQGKDSRRQAYRVR